MRCLMNNQASFFIWRHAHVPCAPNLRIIILYPIFRSLSIDKLHKDWIPKLCNIFLKKVLTYLFSRAIMYLQGKEREVNKMALNKAIMSGKEHRKMYRGSKAIDRTCRNHGSCCWCCENRQYKNLKRLQKTLDMMKDFWYNSITR